MKTPVMETWLRGYCLARALPEPAVVPYGFWIEVAKPQQSGRYFLNAFDASAVASIIAQVKEPATYIEFPGSKNQALSVLPTGWRFRNDAYLMSLAPLVGSELKCVDLGGYTFNDYVHGEVTEVEARSPSGDLAGRGCFAGVGDTAIFDQISTEPAHRQRGVGSTIVNRLTLKAAVDHTSGLLIATEEGRALYAKLGWTELSSVVSIISL